ncbi:MAG: di-trans,poly-cis-decaprenylcistransferase [Planctomycetes bacterium]|nr:di-trans,poly-cis-decaprenylcistransferase [Planctomycetota bacterium]
MPERALPKHVAFIMDGNGRWAEARGLPRAFGHQAGAEAVRRVTEHCRRRGIPYCTLYAFSTENWSRPQAEVEALMDLLAAYVESELATMLRNGVRLRVIGDLGALPASVRERLLAAVAATDDPAAALTLTLAINYGGRDEIVRACRALVASGVPAAAVDEQAVAERLDTAGLPDPDLIVRTAGEMRLSNFLIWQAAYAELVFTGRPWPDFDEAAFEEALAAYGKRTRKFGAVVPASGARPEAGRREPSTVAPAQDG